MNFCKKYCTKITSTLSSLRFSSFLENVRTKAKTWPEFVPAHNVGDVVTSEKMWGKRSLVLSMKTFFKGGFFSESAIRFSNLQKKKNIPKNYPELEI